MKRKTLCLLLVSAAVLGCLPLCFGAAALSPGLAVLANDLTLSKCGLIGNDLAFCADDFDSISGGHTESVTILTLPAPESGTLYLSDRPLACFTEILRDDLSKITFRPACDKENACSFTIRQQTENGKYQAVCNLFMLDRLNFAPTVSVTDENGNAVGCTTYAGIMTSGTLSAIDPEDDPVTFEIVSYPEKGSLTLDGSMYRYTAFADSTGSDSFHVVAIDHYGNRSESAEVTVTVLARESNLSYADMEGHDAYPAALTLSYCGALSGTVIGGEAVFSPDDPITRAEFVAALVTALGIDTTETELPALADFDSIPEHLRPALGAAMANGLVEAEQTFSPNAPITRGDAAGILCAALGIEITPISGTTEAIQPLLVLASRGILPLEEGKMDAESILSRADAAVAICRVLDRI